MKPHNKRFVELTALTPVGSCAGSALPDLMTSTSLIGALLLIWLLRFNPDTGDQQNSKLAIETVDRDNTVRFSGISPSGA